MAEPIEFSLRAVCESCRHVFDPRLLVIRVTDPSVIAESSGSVINNTRPCPRCGGVGRIPDAIYTVAGDALTAIAYHADAAADLARIVFELRRLQDSSLDLSALKREVTRLVPSAASFQGTTRGDWLALIGILVMVFLAYCGPTAQSTTVVNQTTVTNIVTSSPPGVAPAGPQNRGERRRAEKRKRKGL